MRKLKLTFSILMIALLSLAFGVSAQDTTPSITVSDQLSLDGNVRIDSVTSDGPGFVVIHIDNGEGAPGPVIGTLPVRDGTSNDLSMSIDTSAATPTLFAMLHVDTGEVGEYEFGSVDGADLPAMADGEVVVQPMNVVIFTANDQFVTEDNTVTVASVTAPDAGFVVIHADSGESTPGPVVGFAPVDAGTTTGVTVELDGELTDVLWPMLHVDTGEEGVYEFGEVEGVDGPVSVNNRTAVLPIWTVPHVRVFDQPIGMNGTVTVSRLLIDAPGWVVIHADADGSFGEVIGVSEAVPEGATGRVSIEIGDEFVGQQVWAMLHYDTGEEGVYEFGEVDGADGPVVVNEAVVVEPFDVLAAEEPMLDDMDAEATPEAPEATEEPSS